MSITEPVSGSTISSAAFGIPEARVANGFINNGSAACTLALTLTGTLQDVAGCSKTFTIVNGNAFAICWGTFDSANSVTTSNNVGVGQLMVDGVSQSGEAHWDDRVSRTTAQQHWTVPLTAASHTIKLQGKGGGVMTLQTIHTKLTIVVFDLP